MTGPEWWVMRVIHPGAGIPNDAVDVNGEWSVPVEVFTGPDGQEGALIRAQREHSRTGHVHKIVLSTEI